MRMETEVGVVCLVRRLTKSPREGYWASDLGVAQVTARDSNLSSPQETALFLPLILGHSMPGPIVAQGGTSESSRRQHGLCVERNPVTFKTVPVLHFLENCRENEKVVKKISSRIWNKEDLDSNSDTFIFLYFGDILNHTH
jgi:hypothetical protein